LQLIIKAKYLKHICRYNTSNMKSFILPLMVIGGQLLFKAAIAQNIGINNTDPQAELDLYGKLRLRPLSININSSTNHISDQSGYYIFTNGIGADFTVSLPSINNEGTIMILENKTGHTGEVVNITSVKSQETKIMILTATLGWQQINSSTKNWSSTGNANVNANNEYIGSRNDADVVMKRNNVEKLRISDDGIHMSNEIKPNGIAGLAQQVLTSNGNGTMAWVSGITSTEEHVGYGSWGDCNVNAITAFQPIRERSPGSNTRFGNSVSISGDYAIVGVPDDDINGFINNGSAAIYSRNTTSGLWSEVGILTNPAGDNYDNFGGQVAISGDYAIVGAHVDDENGLNNSGSATIFKRNNTTIVWESQGKITNQNPAALEFFGYSVDISGDYAIVGTPYETENGILETGTATIYKRNIVTNIWESQGKLVNIYSGGIDNGAGDHFGWSVAIKGDYAIVGAPHDNHDTNYTENTGSATIFKRNSTTNIWQRQEKLIVPFQQAEEQLGWSVDITDNYAIVGSSFINIGPMTSTGAAFIYKRNTTTNNWGEYHTRLLNPHVQTFDQFAEKVSISGKYAIVSAVSDDENSISNIGTTTIFYNENDVWYPIQKFSRPYAEAETKFGIGIGLDGITKRFIISSANNVACFGKIK
jgi:hypothetical protein